MKATLVYLLLVTSIKGLTTLTLIRDHCFINQTSRGWRGAREYCREYLYAELSSIRNQEENDLLKNVMQNSGGQSWIGYFWSDDLQRWRWLDGWSDSQYTNWADTKPTNPSNTSVTMDRNGEWTNMPRRKTKTFFCSWRRREFVLVTERRTWEEALLYCRERYTDLASVLAPEGAVCLADGKLVENRTTEQLWTSLRYLAGQWLWVSERHATTQSQKEFSSSQGSLPSCPAEPYTCGARVPGSPLARWENRDCQERLNFLCYRAASD